MVRIDAYRVSVSSVVTDVGKDEDMRSSEGRSAILRLTKPKNFLGLGLDS